MKIWCTKITTIVRLIRPFQEFSMHVWQNAHANTFMHAMVCDVFFFFLKFYNFIKGIMRIHSIFKKPNTNVFILHLLTF